MNKNQYTATGAALFSKENKITNLEEAIDQMHDLITYMIETDNLLAKQQMLIEKYESQISELEKSISNNYDLNVKESKYLLGKLHPDRNNGSKFANDLFIKLKNQIG